MRSAVRPAAAVAPRAMDDDEVKQLLETDLFQRMQADDDASEPSVDIDQWLGQHGVTPPVAAPLAAVSDARPRLPRAAAVGGEHGAVGHRGRR